MKRIIFISLIIIAFVSCKPMTDNVDYREHFKEVYKTEFYNDILPIGPDINEIKDIPFYMYCNFDYISDNINEVYNAKDFISMNGGDCEEFAIMYLTLLYRYFDIKGQFCLVGPVDCEDGFFDHAVIKVGSDLIEPQNGRIVSNNYKVAYIYDFAEIFY